MSKIFLIASTLMAGLAVALGAFAAHGLKAHLTTEMLSAFKTGIEYQMIHALALMGIAILLRLTPGQQLVVWAGWLFVLGVVLFSGSLYGLTLTGAKGFGPVTPLGGFCLIAGWACLFASAFRG